MLLVGRGPKLVFGFTKNVLEGFIWFVYYADTMQLVVIVCWGFLRRFNPELKYSLEEHSLYVTV